MRDQAMKRQVRKPKSIPLHAAVSTLMEPAVVCVRHDMAVEDLLSCFLATGVHAAPVLDSGGRLVGFVSLADLVVDRDRQGTTEEVEMRIGLREGGSYELGPGF